MVAGTAGRLYTELMSTNQVQQLDLHIFANAKDAANQKDSTCINSSASGGFPRIPKMDQLTQEIYTQLLELHARDLENENTCLHLQLAAHQYTKYPVVQPNPLQWPHQYPVWTVTSNNEKTTVY